MSETRRVGIVAGAVLLATVATAWAVHGMSPPSGHDPTKGRRGEPARTEGADPGSILGRQRRLALRLEVQLEQPGHAAPLVVTLEGDWTTTVTAVHDGERDVLCEVVGARMSGRGVAQASTADIEALATRLSRRFWVTYRSDGTALQLHFPRGMAPSDRNLLEMIVTETELVRPKAEEPHWTATERDGAGTYLAIYQRLLERPGELVKRKLKYVDVDDTGAPTHSLAVELAASEWRFVLDSAGEVTALEGSDRLRIATPMAPPGSSANPETSHLDLSAQVRLSNARVGSAPELVGSLERARLDLDAAPIGTRTVDRELAVAARDGRLLDGHTTSALLSSARASDSDPLLPARLAALFRRRPESIPAGLDLVRQNSGSALVTAALGTAGTPAALEALGVLARDRAAPRQARVDALNALVRAPQPSPSEVRVATDLLDEPDPEVRRAARMVGGALAFALRVRDPGTQATVERALLGRYPGATASERADLLDGLGNSAGETTLAAAQAGLQDEHAEVRIAAVRALRRIEDTAADRRLAEVLTVDRDERVRIAAIRSAGVRWPDRPTPAAPPRKVDDPLVTSLLHAARADGSEAVRAGAVGLLRRHLDAGPEIPATLAQVAEGDPRPGVRRLAREALPDRSAPPR